MTKFIATCICCLCLSYGIAQIQSPEAFLGYKVGTRFTQHYKLVNYFNYIAQQAPATVKMEQYGLTNEGRPLMLAYIASPENLSRLEAIRINNLRLANLSKDKMAADENAPAIVWLSYNVHGNEASSSEAAMLVLYALANPSNTSVKTWLQNVVVIMDPCVNPDGRDRYVNWYNSIAGKNFNPDMQAREHREPWPGGRTNHYNFDLNRDWAWQTQIETQQRMKQYLKWMPQVHVDYHEQGVNNPYYFAPAAQPYHEVISQWQKDFQLLIGKNHAKYFDASGWLYFTKEVFDLYYPAYGDTYPLYSGAIGMTFEQGGGPRGGLASLTDMGDTLTLVDRATHHYTTSLSTLETSSVNATRLIKEYHRFFNNAVSTGAGGYSTYVIKSDSDNIMRVKALEHLLDLNGIQYGSAQTSSAKGFDYNTGKEASFSITPGDVVISSAQPRATLLRVLFEPRPKLVDSNTYDITAWALPYVYGLNAFATAQKFSTSINSGVTSAASAAGPANTYGYVIPWQGVQSVKALARLLQQGVKVRYAELPFETDNRKFNSGALIIVRTSNALLPGAALGTTVAGACNAAGVPFYPVSSGFVDKGNDFGSSKVHPLKAPKVVLLTGDNVSSTAAGEIWHLFEQQLDYPITLMNANDIDRASLGKVDVIIMPDGIYRFLSDKQSADQFRDWISKGGKVVALEGAVEQLARLDVGIKLKKTAEGKSDSDEKKESKGEEKDPYKPLMNYENRIREGLKNNNAGAIFKVIMDNSHPLAFGYPGYYYTLKQDERIYEFLKEGGWNVGVIKKENQVSGFVGVTLKEKLKDGLLFGDIEVGRGSIVMLADDPLFRNFWENGKLLFCNAVFMVGQ